MGLAIPTRSFECSVDDSLVHIVLNQPDRGNPIDGDFCREFGLAIAELSERADARAVLLSARGRLFSVGGDLMSLVKQGDALPGTIEAVDRRSSCRDRQDGSHARTRRRRRSWQRR